MAKARITVESDFDELVADMLLIAEQFPEVVVEAAEAQLQVLESAIKRNWVSMVPWAHVGDYVYDSMGHNVDHGTQNSDVVGMAGVFLLDDVNARHGKEKKDIKAPQLAYWAEFGFTPNNGTPHVGIPYMTNAYTMSLSEQERVFSETLSIAINRRLSQ